MKLSLIILCLPFLASAKAFRNSYISFELPDSWGCTQEGTEWICTPNDKVIARDVMIILSAQEAGPEDNFTFFQNYLSKPRILTNSKKIPQPSQVVHSKPREINGQQWIEGFHLSSEIEDFYTLYLATVKQGLAVLVSLSAEKSKATQFNRDFSTLVQSIRLSASNELLSAIADKKARVEAQAPIGIPRVEGAAQVADSSASERLAKKFGLTKEMLWGIFAILGLLVAYLAYTTFFPKKKQRR